jgi:SPX domain protein involved in polyphosphate accumulation
MRDQGRHGRLTLVCACPPPPPQAFAELNNTGLRKILKKFDRRATAAVKEVYLASHADVPSLANREALSLLADRAAAQAVELEAIARDLSEVCAKEQRERVWVCVCVYV